MVHPHARQLVLQLEEAIGVSDQLLLFDDLFDDFGFQAPGLELGNDGLQIFAFEPPRGFNLLLGDDLDADMQRRGLAGIARLEWRGCVH